MEFVIKAWKEMCNIIWCWVLCLFVCLFLFFALLFCFVFWVGFFFGKDVWQVFCQMCAYKLCHESLLLGILL